MKKIKIAVLIIIVLMLLTLVGTRQYKYDQVENSAIALDMQLEEVGLWPSSEEMQLANTEVQKEIEDLEKEARRANVDIEEVIAEASSQAEAIYLVQVALEESENREIEIRGKEKFPKLNKLVHIVIPII